MPETVLIEFIGDAKSGVKAAEAQVAANKEVELSAKRASASTAAAGASTSKSLAASAADMKKVGHSMTKFVTLPLLGIGVASAKMSGDFQRSMLEISTQAGGTRKEVEHLSKAVLELTAKGRFAQGPQELSEALFHIESVGIRGAKALKTLKAASDLATVGNADLEATTNALVGAMRTGIKGTTDMRETIGTLNATIGAGNLRMDELSAALGTGFLISAKQVGLSLRDAGAALAELTSQGMPAAQAATRLRMSFTLMAAPTSKAKDALKSVGIESEDLAKAMRKPDGLVKALELLKSHMSDLTKVEQTKLLAEAFGGARSGTTIMALVGQLGDLGKKYNEVGKNADNFGEKLKETAEDPAVQWQKSFAQLRDALIEFGNEIVPVITPVIKDMASAITGMAHSFDVLSPGMRKFIIEMGVAAVAAGPLLRVIGGLTSGLSKVVSLGGSAAGAIGGLGAGEATGSGAAALATQPEILLPAAATAATAAGLVLLYTKSKAFRQEVGKLGDAVKGAFGEVKQQVMPLLHSFDHLGKAIGGIQTPLGSVGHILKSVFVTAFKNAFAMADNVIKGLGKTFAGELQVIRGIVELFTDLIEGKFGKLWGDLKTIFSGGVKAITGIFETLTAQIRPLLGDFGSLMTKGFGAIWGEVKDIFTESINDVIGFINDLISAINIIPGIPDIGAVGTIGGSSSHGRSMVGAHQFGTRAKHEEARRKARGGPITEGALSGDSVPAVLERGEYVLNKKAVAKVGRGSLDALNFHEAPRMALGGVVGEAIGSAASRVGKAVTGTLGGALASLPTPHLPGWVAGVGSYLLKGVSDYITSGFQEEKFGSLKSGIPSFSGSWTKVMAQIAKAKHWNLGDWKWIVGKESGGRVNAKNPTSTAFGLGQLLDSTYAQYGGGPGSSGAEQIQAMARYIADRYGNPSSARQFWEGHNWYAAGGPVELRHRHRRHRHPAPFPDVNPPVLVRENLAEWRGVGSAGLHSGIKNLAGYIMERYPGLSVTSTTGGEHAAGSFHPLGEAVDLAGSSMNAASDWIKSSGLYKTLAEGIHNPNLSVEGGNLVSPSHWGATTWADHRDHIHLAVNKPWQPANSDEHSFKEKVPANYRGVRTGSLSLGSGIPNSLHGINRELKRRRREVARYRAAADAADKENKPGIAQAIRKNVTALETRIHQLEVAQKKERQEKAKRKFSGKLSKRLGSLTGFEQLIEGKERTYEKRSQFAEQVVDLEPLAPELPANATDAEREASERAYVANLTAYIDGKERPAFGAVLESEVDWRNTVLHGEDKATRMESDWETKIIKTDSMIDYINAFTTRTGIDQSEWQRKHPEADVKDRPDWLTAEIKKMHEMRAELPMLRFKDDELRNALGEAREVFYSGAGFVSPPRPPLPGTGSFEEVLENVQGIHWPDQHEILSSLPANRVAGKFGGAIWDTQGSIEELGLKISQAQASEGGGGGGETEQNSALLEAKLALAETKLREDTLERLQYGPFQEFLKHLPPYIGAFKSGGDIPGHPNQAYMAMVHGGETIVPAGGNTQMGPMHFHLRGDIASFLDLAAPGLVKQVDRQMGTKYRHIAFAPGGGR